MMQGQAAVSKDRIRKTSPRKSRKPDRDAIVNEFLPSIRIHAARLKMRIPPTSRPTISSAPASWGCWTR